MRDQIGVDTLANWVSMLRADIDGAILLADDDSEGQFYEKCSHQTARVVPSPSVALQLFERIKARKVAGVVAAVSSPRARDDLPECVFQPSLGDVASLLLSSKCCEQALVEIGGSAWLKACDKEINACSLIDQAIRLAWSLDLVSALEHIHFAPAEAESYVDWTTLSLSDERIANDFGRAAIDRASVHFNESATKTRIDLLAECNGMIAVELLAASTRLFCPRGLRSSRQCAASDFLGMMRLAFDLADLESDRMYWRMRAWERENRKFAMLRKWRILDPLQVVLDQRDWEGDLQNMLANDTTRGGMTAIKMDLDNFKKVNEALGHTVGDEAIKLACSVLISVFSSVAEIYRRGGDELVALAPGLRGSKATQLAELLRTSIEDKFKVWGAAKGLSSPPTASIGLVDVEPGSSYHEVIRLLDDAQGQAKHEGKNRVVVLQSQPR